MVRGSVVNKCGFGIRPNEERADAETAFIDNTPWDRRTVPLLGFLYVFYIPINDLKKNLLIQSNKLLFDQMFLVQKFFLLFWSLIVVKVFVRLSKLPRQKTKKRSTLWRRSHEHRHLILVRYFNLKLDEQTLIQLLRFTQGH